MAWFDRMQMRLTLSQSYVVALISRVFMNRLQESYAAHQKQNLKQNNPATADIDPTAAAAAVAVAAATPNHASPPQNNSNNNHKNNNHGNGMVHEPVLEPPVPPVGERFEKTYKREHAEAVINFLNPLLHQLKTRKQFTRHFLEVFFFLFLFFLLF